MVHPRLQVFLGSENARTATDLPVHTGKFNQVSVALGDVLPLLVDAIETRRAWVHDFEDEKITVSTDLYEVLQAYRQLRPAA